MTAGLFGGAMPNSGLIVDSCASSSWSLGDREELIPCVDTGVTLVVTARRLKQAWGVDKRPCWNIVDGEMLPT